MSLNGPAPSAAPPRKSQSTELVELAVERYDFGRATTGEPFGVPRDGPYVARMLRGGSHSLRAELAVAYVELHGKAPTSSAVADAMLVLEGRAQAQEPTDLGLRVAPSGGYQILDLGTPDGSAVRVWPGRWSVVSRSPVLFRRSELTAPLPAPEAGGSLEDLRPLVNVTDDAWPLLIGWLVMALMPAGAHPILLLTGEQGAGKSTAGRLLVELIDPSPAPLRSSPKDLEEWAVGAAGSWIVGVDNISAVQPWFSDALCRAVTGDGLIRRRLYSDSDLTVLAIRRVLLLTSIDPGALRGDLADRLVAVELGRLAGGRREDREIDAEFARQRPQILGALLDLVVEVLAVMPSVHPAVLPRMADFGRVLAAVDEVMGTDAFGAYLALGQRLAADVVEADPVARAVVRFVEGRNGAAWRGSPADLLDAIRPEDVPRGWPADATRLAARLKRAAPALRSVGVQLDAGRAHGRRYLDVWSGESGAAEESASGTQRHPAAPDSVPEPAAQALWVPLGAASAAEFPSSISAEEVEIEEEQEGQDDGEHSGTSGTRPSELVQDDPTAAAPAAPAEMVGWCVGCGRRTGLTDAEERWRCSSCAPTASVTSRQW